MGKIALITGANSQDGSYLAELLLEKGYKVYGIVHDEDILRIKDMDVDIIHGDMTDQGSLDVAVTLVKPDEIYNLAAQSYYKKSVEEPMYTSDVTGMGFLRLIEAVRYHHKSARVFQASSSEMFGKTKETPQNESTRFHPRSPYGAAKAFAQHIGGYYRDSHKMFISCGVMYNHESPRRGLEFVTRKITEGIARIRLGLLDSIKLGNLNASRDWTHARQMMDGAYRMLQIDTPGDYVLGSGVTHTVKEWLEVTCKCAGLNYWEVFQQDATFERQSEIDYLRANPAKAERDLQWKATISFEEIVKEMYVEDLNLLRCNMPPKAKA